MMARTMVWATILLGVWTACLVGAAPSGGTSGDKASTGAKPPATAPASRPATSQTRPDTQPAATGSVSGKVVGADGKPVAGTQVSVYVMGADRKMRTLGSAKTAKDGSFKIADLAPGKDLRVWASFQVPQGPMWMGQVSDLKVEAGKNTDAGTIKIQPATM